MPPSVARPTFGLSRYSNPDDNDWAAYLAHVAARPAASRLSAGAEACTLAAEAMLLGHPVRALG